MKDNRILNLTDLDKSDIKFTKNSYPDGQNNLVIKPEKLSLDEFYQWTLLTGNYNFFQLLPYLQGGGCIYRISTMLEGEYIKLASFSYMPECLHFTKYKNGIIIGIFMLSYHDLIHDDWKILHETLTY